MKLMDQLMKFMDQFWSLRAICCVWYNLA